MALSLTDFSKRLFHYYKPYFGTRKKSLARSLMALGILVTSVMNAFLLAFINSSLTGLIGLIEYELTWTAFASASVACLGYGALYVGVCIIQSELFSRFSSSLSQSINNRFVKRWINNKAYYGIKFLSYQEDKLDPAQILSHDNIELIEESSSLIHSLLTAISLFVVGVITLYTLSMPLAVTVFSLSFQIPGYIALGSLLYAWGYNIITGYIGKPLNKAENKIRDAECELSTLSYETMSQAEAIALNHGTKHEAASLKQSFHKLEKHTNLASAIKRKLELVTDVHYSVMSYIVPILLALPNLIAKKMNPSGLYQILQHFTSVVSMFTWKNEYLPMLTTCEVSLSRIEQFNKMLTDWEKHLQNIEENKPSKMPLRNKKNQYDIQDLTVLKPDNTLMFHPVSLRLQKAKATHIQGRSGMGKTTLIRAVANLWPYLKPGGSICFPENAKVEFIPQQGFVYHHGQTLSQAIQYPKKKTLTTAELRYVKNLMKEMKFKAKTINEIEKVKDWKSELSGGEKQRVAIIAAIFKKPDILFMDEATSAIDSETKVIVEKIVKRELPQCAIAFVDHHASSGQNQFNDNSYTLKNPRMKAR